MYFVAPEQASGLTSEEISRQYGVKAAGLLLVPHAWRPPFLLMPSSFYEGWHSTGQSFSASAKRAIAEEFPSAVATLGADCMLRSSATDETIDERGNYLSVEINLTAGIDDLLSKAAAIFEDYRTKGAKGQMCIILHTRIRPLRQGFLSNELRLVDKPYRWAVQSEIATNDGASFQTTTLSAKQAANFAVEDPLIW